MLLQTDAYIFVAQCLARLGLRKSFVYLGDEPGIVVNQTLHRFHNERHAIAPLLRGNARKFVFEFARKRYFHSRSIKTTKPDVKQYFRAS